ncbi:hypothetical protein EYC84_010917 [Monilinia fructicola]|uniref:Uncharacterized protein n=1 Tax=Monilinia fructicola TaxID=38448 RepID=A0A5M9J6M0_MONFR|nr:hypothetical protein EYC84_010917 [Monilinia fructicola]
MRRDISTNLIAVSRDIRVKSQIRELASMRAHGLKKLDGKTSASLTIVLLSSSLVHIVHINKIPSATKHPSDPPSVINIKT